MDRLIRGLIPFLLFDVPYSSDIEHAYKKNNGTRSASTLPNTGTFQFQRNGVNIHKFFLYGGIQSETILELAIRRAVKDRENKIARDLALY